MKPKKYSDFLILALSLGFFSLRCSQDNSQFTKKLAATPFVSKLYGETTKILAIQSEPGSHIAWMGLDWSADYRFFQMDQISVNDQVTTPEAISPTAVLIGIPPSPSSPSATDSAEGIAINDGRLLVTITYKPLKAIEADSKPHKAYLLLAYDQPQEGTVRIELDGYTKGICDKEKGETCNFSDTGELAPKNYKLVDNTLEIFTCHPQITIDEVNNDPDHPNTRHDPVTVEDPFVFYVAGTKTAHIVSNTDGGLLPSVPPFVIPLPKPIGEIDELDAKLVDPQNVECPLDSSGGFRCGEVKLEVFGGIVTVSDFIVSTGTESPSSSQCGDFGNIGGAPGVNGSTMTVVAWGTIKDNPMKIYLDALVVAVLPLELVE